MNAEPVSRPSLRRRVDHRIAAGVMGGIADAVNAPAGLLRVLLLFASTFSQWVLIGYLVLALVIPPRGRNRPSWDNLVGLGRFGVLFLGAWVWLSPGTDNIDFQQWLWISAGGLGACGLAVVLTATYPRGPTPEQARGTVLATLPLIAFGGAIAGGIALFPGFRWERLIPFGAVLMGLVLTLAARKGWWRSLVAPCVAAVVLTAIAAGSGLRLDGGFADKVVVAHGAAPPRERVAVGKLRVVVANPGPHASSTVRASIGIGTLRIVVPRRAMVTIDAKIGRGRYDVAARHVDSGVGIHLRPKAYVLPDPYPKRPHPVRVHVIADVGVGNLDVHRAGGRDAWF